MAFDKFEYSKSWRNPSDFPTIETSEVQVRDDMQILFDEIAAAHNQLAQSVWENLNGMDLLNLVHAKSDSVRYMRLTSAGRLQCSSDGNNWITVLGGADGTGADGETPVVTYELPVASSKVLGGVKADPATSADTQPVRIGVDGKLYTAPTSNGGSGELPDNLLTTEGGTMTGALHLYRDPVEETEAATKHYVDEFFDRFVLDETGVTVVHGKDGSNGVSPTVNVIKSGRVTTVKFNDVEGVKTALITDGKDGRNGKDGTDGVSPTVSLTKVGKVTTLSVTDAEGTKSVNILDGEGGSSEGGSAVELDTTLTKEGAAAEARAVGEMVVQLKRDIATGVNTAKTYADDKLKLTLDDTLAVQGAAADAYAVGQRIAQVEANAVKVDNTMTVSGAAADAKIVGAVVEELWKAIITSLESAKKYTDDKVGNVNDILDAINGEVI